MWTLNFICSCWPNSWCSIQNIINRQIMSPLLLRENRGQIALNPHLTRGPATLFIIDFNGITGYDRLFGIRNFMNRLCAKLQLC